MAGRTIWINVDSGKQQRFKSLAQEIFPDLEVKTLENGGIAWVTLSGGNGKLDKVRSFLEGIKKIM